MSRALKLEQKLSHSRRDFTLSPTLMLIQLNLLHMWSNICPKFGFSFHQLFFSFIKIFHLVRNTQNWKKKKNLEIFIVTFPKHNLLEISINDDLNFINSDNQIKYHLTCNRIIIFSYQTTRFQTKIKKLYHNTTKFQQA